MPSRSIISERGLNRAVLARQLLLERSPLSVPRALERIAGIQAQYAPSSYVRLWTCLRSFEMADLNRLLERKAVVQATLMRSTIHVVSRRDYWPFIEGVRPAQLEWWLRTWDKGQTEGVDLFATFAGLERELHGRTWTRKEIEARFRAAGLTMWPGWIPMVRVPPAGTWTHRRADLFQVGRDWVGPSRTDETTGVQHLLRRYLGGFGPGRLSEAAKWAGVDTSAMVAAAERLTLRTLRDEEGKELVDIPRAPLPDPTTRAPVRFLPNWDAALLVHCRRTQILPEAYRSLVFGTPNSIGTFLADGHVAGSWKVRRSGTRAELVYAPFERLPAATDREVRDEGTALVRFHEPDASSFTVRRALPGGSSG